MKDKLFEALKCKGYPLDFCQLVAEELHTDFTAKRMIGYLRQFEEPPTIENITDEMLSIISDRDRIVDKKKHEYYNSKWNEYLWLQKNDLID